MVFWTTFIIGTFDQNTFLLVRKSKKFWENVRIWEKICRFETGSYFSISILFVFFSIPIIFTNFLESLSGHFFDFLSYMAGNCILVWKVETNFRKIKKCVILKPELIFQFRFYSLFFSIPITFTNFLAVLSGHFFDFLSYMAGNCIFWCQI